VAAAAVGEEGVAAEEHVAVEEREHAPVEEHVPGHAPVEGHARVVVHPGVGDLATMLPVPHRCRGRPLRTFEDRVAARAELQTIGQRWAICRRRAIDPVRGPETGLAEATLPVGRTWVIGRAQVLDRAQVFVQELVRELSLDHDQEPAHGQEPAHDHRRATYKTFLACRMSVAAMSAAAGHQAALVMGQPPPVAHWRAVRLQSF
jgi:hypothetical protein